MSFTLMAQTMKLNVGSLAKKMVLIKLADQANDDGLCWPSYQTIAEACQVSRRTVIRHIKSLEEDGYLNITKTYDKANKKNFSNRYQLTISRGVKMSLVTESHHPSDNVTVSGDTESLPSDRESPEPIIEPIIEPAIEAGEKNNSNDNAEKVKDSNAEFIVNWQPPTRETMEAKLFMAGTPMQMTDGQYQLYVDDFKAHFEDRAKDGHPLKSDGKCQAKLRDWLQREREGHNKNMNASGDTASRPHDTRSDSFGSNTPRLTRQQQIEQNNIEMEKARAAGVAL
ncbi:helix-turn-helix domain-containing protein [Psychrobacter sp. K31L]|uniref:helix-turn-helix domain-containing protein n=1 Tax=Psychrobacter sp. K31L TaxID=2820758 RepID=UPI001B34366B|nr:helix-turn-helix domain-containing protein [Psychrobacter sp. K31L]MBP3945142.1 helix-turn-helix domain-containing protein [Psychrobacter sp. K31L]